jgi:sulfur carrier protein
MKKIKKIKIKLNGKNKTVKSDSCLHELINELKIPIKKIAIELNREIVDKKKIKKIKLKNNDVIEIVHFIGGG